MMTLPVAMVKDAATLTNIDIKCNDYPYSLDIYKMLLLKSDNIESKIVKLSGRAVGYYVASIEDTSIDIERICVLPEFSGLGISRKLMKEIESKALKKGKKYIDITVPCYKVDDREETFYIRGWLKALEFKAIEVVEQCYNRYGRSYDGYIFRKQVPQTVNK